MKILIATPCSYGMVRAEYLTSMIGETFCAPDRLADIDRYDIGFYTTSGYSGLGRDRGVIASYALRAGVDKLLFIDNDMRWKWRDVQQIVDSERPILAGVAPLKKFPILLNFTPLPEDSECFRDENQPKEDQTLITPSGLKRWHKKYHHAPELRVTATGTAFMAIDRKVLEKLAEARAVDQFYFNDISSGKQSVCWDFFPTGAIDGLYLGEDWGFCRIAAHHGFHTFVNPNVCIDHVGDHEYRVFGEDIRS